MSVINTNITSMIGQSNLAKSQSALQTSMERLSSGLRINSAKDDAAGQAIANRMSAQITGLAQAQRNANDGISLAQTAEGSLNQINDNLQRIRELTTQAQNGTNSADDLTSIQNEIGQRLIEINRISDETQFNGVKVLASDQGVKIQVGANDGQAITVNLEEINAETLGLKGFNVDGKGEVANKAATADDLTLAGFTAGTPVDGTTQYDKTTTVANTAATSANLFAKAEDGDTVTFAGANNGLNTAATGDYTYDAASDSFSFNANGVATADAKSALTPATGETKTASVTIGGSKQDVIISSDGSMRAADDNAALYLDGDGNLTKNQGGTTAAATVDNVVDALENVAGDSISVGGTTFTSDGADFDVTGATISASKLATETAGSAHTVTLDGTAYAVDAAGEVTAGGAEQYVNADGDFTADDETTTTVTYFAHENGNVTDNTGKQVYKTESNELTFDATTVSEATSDPLKALDAALNQVDSLRSDLGAIQNRFESAITNLNTNETNLSAARSRIEDADYAVEVANMTRAQILQQAGTSVLAQANQIPQSVLSLLG
ncbi:flagellin FliC [Halomonas aquamarina]|uniref:Flagellin FliC n=1 Tax=Vreelandella aquamarina TaxID=77097 RepID=A0ACC5VXS5_9GAMM|nr:flagellin [Halomonas aquamarina]MBZ5488685.1 flagellin FliC [Halomonas aquamarina]